VPDQIARGDGARLIANPLREGLRLERIPEPCTMVICGATGDLTTRKLGPALYNLMLGGFLPPEFSVVGFARRPLSDEEFREQLRQGIDQFSRNKPVKPSVWKSFSRGIEFHAGEFHELATYADLAKRLDRIDRDRGTAGNRLFYLAVPPILYPEIVKQLGAAGLAETGEARRDGKRGWVRDIVQNHALQLMTMFAIEPPVEFVASDLRDEKLKVLRAVKPMTVADVADNVVRGQYVSGWVEGHKVHAYRDEPEVDPKSDTETFVALKLGIDSWRWAGVPFYLRTGKAMPTRVTEIAVQFRRAPLALFARAGAPQIDA